MEPMFLALMFLITAFAQTDNSVEINVNQNEEISLEILEELKIIKQDIQDLENTSEVELREIIRLDTAREQGSTTISHTNAIIGIMASAVISAVTVIIISKNKDRLPKRKSKQSSKPDTN